MLLKELTHTLLCNSARQRNCISSGFVEGDTFFFSYKTLQTVTQISIPLLSLPVPVVILQMALGTKKLLSYFSCRRSFTLY